MASAPPSAYICAMGTSPGYIVVGPPKIVIAGISTNHPSSAPANIYDAILIPQIYPTPRSAGYTSAENAVLRERIGAVTTPGTTFKPSVINLKTADNPIPANTVFALVPPSSPAKRTSAHAVPSGYGNTPCSLTIKALRSGIINSTPRTPPTKAISEIVSRFGASVFPSFAHKNKAGSVNIAPAARDSPAEPIVCTMLLSRIESFFIITRITPIEITAAGIDAETVIPTRRPRYAFAAPKIIASKTPMMIDVAVNSGVTLSAGTYGLNSLFSIIVLLLFIPRT